MFRRLFLDYRAWIFILILLILALFPILVFGAESEPTATPLIPGSMGWCDINWWDPQCTNFCEISPDSVLCTGEDLPTVEGYPPPVENTTVPAEGYPAPGNPAPSPTPIDPYLYSLPIPGDLYPQSIPLDLYPELAPFGPFPVPVIESDLSNGNCGSHDHKIGSAPFVWTAPQGSVITKVIVKSGQGCFVFKSNGNDGCYKVSGIGTNTAKASRVGEAGPECQEISHVEFYLSSIINTPTNTSPPPKDTPTNTSTSTKSPPPTETELPGTPTATEPGDLPTPTDPVDQTPTPTDISETPGISPTPETTPTDDEVPTLPPPEKKKKKSTQIVLLPATGIGGSPGDEGVVGAMIGVILLVTFISIMLFRRRKV